MNLLMPVEHRELSFSACLDTLFGPPIRNHPSDSQTRSVQNQ